MKKSSNLALTIIIGFIAGLAISGILGDIIVMANKSVGKISSAWAVKRAERQISGGNFAAAVREYEKALKKISPANKKLLAKIKNNMALCIFTEADKDGNASEIERSVKMFSESLDLYKELNDAESISQVETNINEAESVLASLGN
jgi:hypothetical protein